MLINFTQEILDYKGEPILEEVRKTENGNIDISTKPMTLKSAVLQALNNSLPNELITAEDKVRSYDLSLKIWNNESVDLSADDVVLIKNRANVIWSTPSVYVSICKLLDNKEQQ